MTNYEPIFGDIDAHVARITNELAEFGIGRSELAELDHLCYRVETNERYEEMKQVLGEIALLRGETEVQGRMIAIFRLNEYIQSNGWVIPYIELPAPKEGSPYKEGLEHAEFVVVGDLDVFQGNHAGAPFDTKAMDRPVNPELGLKTNRAAMKFHKLQIGAVVDIERVTQPISSENAILK